MHHLVIGEGQIGRAIIDRALADGDRVTVLRRSVVEPTAALRRVSGDVLEPEVLSAAVHGADAVHACFHAPYRARVWARELPPRERAVLDAAAARDIPVIFPESLYAFAGEATDLAEGAPLSPRDAKGQVRARLLEQRRAHAARTLSLMASDLIGPTAVGTGAAVVCALLLERIAAGRRPIVFGDPEVGHALTYIPDLAVAMLHAARRAERLAPDGNAVLHAPSASARSQAALLAQISRLHGIPTPRPRRIPRLGLRLLAPLHPFVRELHGIAGLWYEPCVLREGILVTEEQLVPTSWEQALRTTWRTCVARVR